MPSPEELLARIESDLAELRHAIGARERSAEPPHLGLEEEKERPMPLDLLVSEIAAIRSRLDEITPHLQRFDGTVDEGIGKQMSIWWGDARYCLRVVYDHLDRLAQAQRVDDWKARAERRNSPDRDPP